MTMVNIVAIFISCGSLIVAIIALAKSAKSQKLSNEVNRIVIEEHKKKNFPDPKIDIEIQKRGSAYKLHVWNSGNVPLKQINIKSNTNGLHIEADDVLPYEVLERNDYFGINIFKVYGTPNKVEFVCDFEYNEKHISKNIIKTF